MGKWDKFKTWDTLVLEAIAKEEYRGAAEALVGGYLNVVVGFCTNLLGDKDLAEEVAQEVFIAAYQAMPRYRDGAALRTWVFQIARHKCWKVLRDRKNRQRLEDGGPVAYGQKTALGPLFGYRRSGRHPTLSPPSARERSKADHDADHA